MNTELDELDQNYADIWKQAWQAREKLQNGEINEEEYLEAVRGYNRKKRLLDNQFISMKTKDFDSTQLPRDQEKIDKGKALDKHLKQTSDEIDKAIRQWEDGEVDEKYVWKKQKECNETVESWRQYHKEMYNI